ncbi:hypothetical protein GQ457_16G007940 [Hibiscus cannabinus]
MNPPRKNHPQCSYCGLLGHTKEKCYKLHGYPPGYASRSKNSANNTVVRTNVVDTNFPSASTESLTSQQCQQLIAMLTSQLQAASTSDVSSTSINLAMQGKILSFVNSLSSFDAKNSWIIDFGASRHVCYSKELFESFFPITAGTILLPNKTVVSVEFAGTVRLSDRFLLKDVLYVPDFRFNILAVSCLIRDSDLTVLFSRSHCLIQDLCQVIGKASWHHRVGHPSSNVLQSLKDVLPSYHCNKNECCTICPLAKQKFLSFPISSTHAVVPFELVHCDVRGLYKTPTYNNHCYFITLVDDYSRSTWTYLIKHKSDVPTIIPSFISMVKRQFGCDLKQFRSDNAPELRFTDLFSALGIIHQYSCVETPQQNSVVERKHQHLLAVARALFFQSRVPIRFWGECILTATYIINRLPSKNLDGKSPYELLHHQLPSYSHFKVFGCLCFVSTLKSSRDKFTERALPGIFIGYAPGIKGYKVYILQTRTIVVSRNVIFHEEIFPFHSIVPFDSLVDPFPSIVLPHILHDASHGSQEIQGVVDSSGSDCAHDVESDSAPACYDSASHGSASNEYGSEFVHNDESNLVPNETVAPIAAERTLESQAPVSVVRRSSRVSHKPSYLTKYYCNNTASSSCLYPTEDHISTSQLSSDYTVFVANLSSSYEPVFYHQAVKYPEWRDAMTEELQAMESHHTWSVVSLPPGKQAIDCKWVYRIKRKADGSIDRYKARLVAKGFTQIEGIDYTNTFSPVAKMTSFKLLLALATVHNWHLFQLDVNNAFLNGMLDEEVYMKLPLGYTTDVSGSNLVCKLHKSIYGLKQASRQWFHAFSQVVLRFGFSQSPSDHLLFVKGSGDDMVVLLVYVDDIILAGKNSKLLVDVRVSLQQHFKLKDLGILKYFLGFEIARNQSGISLSQRQYALQLLEDTGTLAKKLAEVPIQTTNMKNIHPSSKEIWFVLRRLLSSSAAFFELSMCITTDLVRTIFRNVDAISFKARLHSMLTLLQGSWILPRISAGAYEKSNNI